MKRAARSKGGTAGVADLLDEVKLNGQGGAAADAAGDSTGGRGGFAGGDIADGDSNAVDVGDGSAEASAGDVSVEDGEFRLDSSAGGANRHTRRVMEPFKGETPAHSFAVDAARLLRDDKCEDVVVLDVRGMSQITDYVVIGSGTSERQMRSILRHVEEIGGTRGFQAFRTNTDERASWVLVDFVDVVVHLFEPNTRAHYDLETLWPEAKRLEWERPDQLERDRAGLHA